MPLSWNLMAGHGRSCHVYQCNMQWHKRGEITWLNYSLAASLNSGIVANMDAFMFFFILSTSEVLFRFPRRFTILAVASFHLILAALPLSSDIAAVAALATCQSLQNTLGPFSPRHGHKN